MQTLTVLMGAPGAGKSTWLKSNNTGNEYIASNELVRLNRDIDVAAYTNQVRINGFKALQAGKDVIVDATNTITQHRLYWLKVAKAKGVKTRLIVFNTNINALLSAQVNRQFPTPRNVVISHHKNMSIANQLIKNESWDEIVMVNR
jgi:predicted kinase